MRDDARADSNQAEIVDALRKLGCTVISLHRVGHGCPDLLIGHRGVNYLLEIKTRTGRLTPQQIAFREMWQGDSAVVHNTDEALMAIGAWEYNIQKGQGDETY